jgi:hypothetical protein
MGRSIVKQPNGNYALFSTIVDGFIFLNATRDELIKELVQEATEKITKDVDKTLEAIRTGVPYWNGYAIKPWDEAKEEHESIHPKLEKGSY